MRITALTLLSLAALGCGGDDSTGPPVATPPDVVIVTGAAGLGVNAYVPSPVTISLATKQTVKWKNNDAMVPAHTVTADAGAFDSGSLAESNTYTFTFTTTGTYNYHCSIHPAMVGQIIVNP